MKDSRKKVCILTSRNVGEECIKWATSWTPPGFVLVDTIEDCEILISIMYDKIISKKDLKNKICFNFHPGTLPAYRGVGFCSWVIINNERKTGVTLHLMDAGVDTGDIIEIREFLILAEDTAHSLFARVEELIYKMFKDWYIDLLNNNFTAAPQRQAEGSTYKKIDLQKAKNLTRFAKAFHFPGKEPAYYFNNKREKIFLNYKGEK